MSIPKPSEARIVVQHHEDGRSVVLLDGKHIPGLISAQVVQEMGKRAVLNISISGFCFRLETSPLTASQATAERRASERG